MTPAEHSPFLHPWNLSPAEAVAVQKRLATEVQRTVGFDLSNIRTIAGIDASYREIGRAAIVVLSYPDLELVEQATAEAEIAFPYVPGLLSFRETPVVLAVFAKLRVRPDVLMLDGQGIAHPRRFGIACHVGLLTGLPAIGVAKSVLTGRYENLGDNPGDAAPLLFRSEQIGVALRAKRRTNPLILSIGHKIDLPTTLALVQNCLRGYRLPETTRRAHLLAGTLPAALSTTQNDSAEAVSNDTP